jgi:hypothetical protein
MRLVGRRDYLSTVSLVINSSEKTIPGFVNLFLIIKTTKYVCMWYMYGA